MENELIFIAGGGDSIKFIKTNGEILPLKICIGAIHDYLLEKQEAIALRNFLNSLDLEPKQELSETAIVEQSENFIHLRTNNVPEWVKRIEEVNKQIVAELDEQKDCPDGQHEVEQGECTECVKQKYTGKCLLCGKGFNNK